MKRVLAAAGEHPLALIVSSVWHDAVIEEGRISPVGYEEVWVEEQTFAGAAWVKVPGLIRPPGLLPDDYPRRLRVSHITDDDDWEDDDEEASVVVDVDVGQVPPGHVTIDQSASVVAGGVAVGIKIDGLGGARDSGGSSGGGDSPGGDSASTRDFDVDGSAEDAGEGSAERVVEGTVEETVEASAEAQYYGDGYGGRTRKRAEQAARQWAELEALLAEQQMLQENEQRRDEQQRDEQEARQAEDLARLTVADAARRKARVPPARPRYLVGQCPESVAVGKPFSLLASINVAASPTSAELEPFDVPSEGQDVVLVMYAPGLHVLSDHQQTVHVPADEDSRPVRFELRADTPGPAKVSITAWIGGTHLGELRVEITAERDRAPGPHREVLAEITTQPTAGAVSLVVRYDPSQQAYRFEFRDEDNPDEVPSNLAYDPGPLVEQLIADLDSLAEGRSGYSADQTRDYLVNAGARLWQQLVPGQLREQFWDRQRRIRQLTILADKDAVPWELLYPMDPGHDAGFLVEQFPVTRAVFGWRPGRTLRLRPARFVLPEGSLHEAAAEVEAMRRLLDPGQAPGAVISELTPLTDLIGSGKFGLLHFACHNTYEPVGGSSIRLGRVRFTPTLLEVAAIQKALQASAPTVFINACRSAGLAATYNRLDGWASKFLEAGAAAFIGSLWAVSDGASREFAEELYRRLKRGSTLGDAVMAARQAAASTPDDPTWLAYTVYGDPRATISQSP